jgi:hypothetical protein
MTPDKPEDPDQDGNAHDLKCIAHQPGRFDPHGRQIVDRPFDDPWNKELKDVDNDQADYAGSD